MIGKLISLSSIRYQKELTKIMRIDSCRKCGEILEVNKKCNMCNKANEFFVINVEIPLQNKLIHSVC